MKLFSIKNISISLLILAAAASISTAQTYSGQAFAAKATVAVVDQPVVTAGLSDTGELSYTGGNVNLVGAGTTLAGIVTVGASTINTSGGASVSNSTAQVAGVGINVVGNNISIGAINASTSSNCTVSSGSSSVAGVQINGVEITVLGTPNQSVTIFSGGPGGTIVLGQLILNEEIVGPRGITRNAVHLTVTALDLTKTEVIVSSARSGLDCAGQAAITNIFGGRGTTVTLNQNSLIGPLFLSTTAADTGRLPWVGGDTSVGTLPATVGGLIDIGTATSTTEGGIPAGTPNATASSSSVEDLGIDVGLLSLGASALTANTHCSCSATVATCSGSSNTAGLDVRLLGIPVDIDINPPTNFSINLLGVGILRLNEEVTSGSGNFSAITRNALRLDLNLLVAGTDVTVASSRSSIVCGLAPTAGEVTLSGRVTDNYGRGLSRAAVTAVDGSGLVRTVITNSFGNFVLRDMPAGRTYFVSVAGGKQFTFEGRSVSLDDSVSGFDFTPSVPSVSKKL